MRRHFGFLSIVTALCLSFTLSTGFADDKPAAGEKKADAPKAAAGPLCPISGMPIKESISAEFKGKKVYFCCDKCPAKFNESPDKFKEQVKAQWSAMIPLRMQVTCPGTGKPVNPKVSSTENGETVYFCCEGCKGKWDKGDQDMRKAMGKCYTFQTRCPMMGDEQIDPKSSETVDGKTVYFCCDDCKGGFAKDKAAGMKKVDEQIKANQTAWIMKQAAAKPAAPAGEKKEEKKDGGK